MKTTAISNRAQGESGRRRESGAFWPAARWHRAPRDGAVTVAEVAAPSITGLKTYRFDSADIDRGGAAGRFQSGARRVLVLAANAEFRTAALTALTGAGYDASAMRDGFQASQLLHWYRPELVVVNLPLPRPEGWEPVAQIRAQAPEAVVVVLAEDPSLEAQAKAGGAAEFLAKPIAVDELVRVVARLLSRPPA